MLKKQIQMTRLALVMCLTAPPVHAIDGLASKPLHTCTCPSFFQEMAIVPASFVSKRVAPATAGHLHHTILDVLEQFFHINMTRRGFLTGAALGAVGAVAGAPARDATGLDEFWNDIGELPKPLLASLKKKALEQKWDQKSFLDDTLLYKTNLELMKVGFYIQFEAVENPKPSFAKGPVGVRAVLLHLSPTVELRQTEARTIRVHEVVRRSGRTDLGEFNGLAPMESEEDVFWFGEPIRELSQRIVELRNDRELIQQETSAEKKNALKIKSLERLGIYMMIRDPLAYDILEETFGALSPEEIFWMVRERVILHETVHALTESEVLKTKDHRGHNFVAEHAAYSGNIMLGLHPYFQLLYLANQMVSEAHHIRQRSEDDQVFSSTFVAIEEIFTELGLALTNRGGVKGADWREVRQIRGAENRAMATIHLLQKYKISEQDLRDMARAVFEKSHGKAPALKLARDQTPFRLLAAGGASLIPFINDSHPFRWHRPQIELIEWWIRKVQNTAASLHENSADVLANVQLIERRLKELVEGNASPGDQPIATELNKIQSAITELASRGVPRERSAYVVGNLIEFALNESLSIGARAVALRSLGDPTLYMGVAGQPQLSEPLNQAGAVLLGSFGGHPDLRMAAGSALDRLRKAKIDFYWNTGDNQPYAKIRQLPRFQAAIFNRLHVIPLEEMSEAAQEFVTNVRNSLEENGIAEDVTAAVFDGPVNQKQSTFAQVPNEWSVIFPGIDWRQPQDNKAQDALQVLNHIVSDYPAYSMLNTVMSYTSRWSLLHMILNEFTFRHLDHIVFVSRNRITAYAIRDYRPAKTAA